jgi:branched-chain amino acid transport system ATP-binding protein
VSLLSVEGISADYGLLHAVRDVSFELAEGETLALVGANGAGKSTLFRAIVGAHAHVTGRIILDGSNISKVPTHRRVFLGLALVPEGRRLFPELTVEENLLVGRAGGRKGPWDLRSVVQAFPVLERLRSRQARTLSGGEQQATSIARALMANPRVLLVDEVSLGLAPLAIDMVYKSLVQLTERGTSIVLVEQNLTRALGFADRLACMLEGVIVLQGARGQLTREQITAQYFGLGGSTVGSTAP